jgi:hypothetical protein
MARFVDDLSIRLAKRIGRRGLLSAAGGALAGLGFGARPRSTLAQRPRRRRYPFRMRVTGRVTSPLDPSCFTGATPCRTVVTGEGIVHRMGAVFVTAESTFVVDPANFPPPDGCFPIAGTLTLRATQAGAFGLVSARIQGGRNCLTGGGTGAEVSGRLRIVHGTGTYRGARGTSSLSGMTSPDGLITFEGAGRISY